MEKTGTDQEARPIAVTAQGGIEEALTRMCSSREITDVEAFFLTPLPTTPLRKKGNTPQLAADFFEVERQYTLDKREHTVRGLREHAMINAAYNLARCNALEGGDLTGEQFQNWQVEKEHRNVRDLPTDKEIPAELVGAAYTWKVGSEAFLIITQGVQAKDAAPGTTTWKLWFEPLGSDGPGNTRFAQVKAFIES